MSNKLGRELLEAIFKKGQVAGEVAEEVSDAAVIRNLQKEADDIVQPLGSGANLEALQRASAGVSTSDAAKLDAMQKGAANAPSVDTGLDINTQNLGLSYDNVKSPNYKMPDASGIKATKESADSLAQTASKLEGSIDFETAKRMDPKLAALAAIFGAGGIATMMGGNKPQVQIPMAPQAKQVPKQEAAPQPITPIERSKSVDKITKAQEVVAPIEQAVTEPDAPSQQEIDYMDLMRQAQADTSQNQFENALLRAGTQAGAAIAGLGAGQNVKADYGMTDALKETAGRPVTNVKGLMETDLSQKKMTQLKDEMGDESKMRDPNSEVSKLTTDLAVKAGLIKPGVQMSAMALKNAGVNLGNLLSTIEAGKARKEAMQLQREAMSASKTETNKLKVQGSVDRQVSQLLKSKDYEAYNAAKDAQNALQFAIESGDKTTSGSAFMQFAKIAQGDNSVVRDGDMAILAGGYNYTSVPQMLTKLAAKAQGGNFNNSELKQMQQVASMVQQIKGKRVQQLVNPILERTQAAQLNLAESLDPAMVEEFSGKSSQSQGLTTKTGKTLVSKQYSKSRNQTKMVFSDGSEEIVDGRQ